MSYSELGLEDLFKMSGEASIVHQAAAERWTRVPAVAQQREDRLPRAATDELWNRIFRCFGATGEGSRDEAFVAVNAYLAINGCSPEGRYSRPIRTAGGIEVPSSDVVKITGRLEGDIRQFLRGRMEDSYNCLKYSPALHSDEAARARAEAAGIPRHMVYLLADWLRGCEFLTAEEEEVYTKVSQRAIERARERRQLAKRESGNRADLQADMTPVESTASGVTYGGY